MNRNILGTIQKKPEIKEYNCWQQKQTSKQTINCEEIITREDNSSENL